MTIQTLKTLVVGELILFLNGAASGLNTDLRLSPTLGESNRSTDWFVVEARSGTSSGHPQIGWIMFNDNVLTGVQDLRAFERNQNEFERPAKHT
eukprot:6201559-Pleurochrysis_carterae.AAC.3